MSKVLARYVYVVNPDEPSASRWFEPGDTLPEWAAKIATAPGLFMDNDLQNDGDLFDEIDYTAMKVDQIKLLLTERNLETSGNKAELIKRLEAHDASIG